MNLLKGIILSLCGQFIQVNYLELSQSQDFQVSLSATHTIIDAIGL